MKRLLEKQLQDRESNLAKLQIQQSPPAKSAEVQPSLCQKCGVESVGAGSSGLNTENSNNSYKSAVRRSPEKLTGSDLKRPSETNADEKYPDISKVPGLFWMGLIVVASYVTSKYLCTDL